MFSNINLVIQLVVVSFGKQWIYNIFWHNKSVVMLNLLISLAIFPLTFNFSLVFNGMNFKMVDCVTIFNTRFAVNILCLVSDKKQDNFQQNTSWINNIHGHDMLHTDGYGCFCAPAWPEGTTAGLEFGSSHSYEACRLSAWIIHYTVFQCYIQHKDRDGPKCKPYLFR